MIRKRNSHGIFRWVKVGWKEGRKERKEGVAGVGGGDKTRLYIQDTTLPI